MSLLFWLLDLHYGVEDHQVWKDPESHGSYSTSTHDGLLRSYTKGDNSVIVATDSGEFFRVASYTGVQC